MDYITNSQIIAEVEKKFHSRNKLFSFTRNQDIYFDSRKLKTAQVAVKYDLSTTTIQNICKHWTTKVQPVIAQMLGGECNE